MLSLTQNSNWLNWWLQGLLLLLPENLRYFFSGSITRSQLFYQNNKLLLGERDEKNALEFDISSPLDMASLERTLKESGVSEPLNLTLAQQYGLTKLLRLPAAAESELNTILRFEVDRQTPFNADQVYYAYQIQAKHKVEKTLDIRLDVVPRRVLDPTLEQLKKSGVKINAVMLDSKDSSPINLITNTTSHSSSAFSKLLISSLLILLALLIALNIFLPFYKNKHQLELTETATQQARQDAMEVNQLRSEWEADLQRKKTLQEKMQQRITSTQLLDELTRLIPDDTYLTRVQIREPAINIQGESSSATQLISLLDQSDLFSETRFQSPVTTNISSGKERFQISIQLDQNSESKP